MVFAKVITIFLPLHMDEVVIKDKTFQKFIPEETLLARISELAAEINTKYADLKPLFVAVLNGAFLFAADFMRELTIKPEIQFIRVSTYGDSMESNKRAKEIMGLAVSPKGRHIVLIEDIVDTGFTAQYLRNELGDRGAASVAMISLLFKPEPFQGDVPPEFVGFEIPPEFVVGYGLDYAQEGRELRSIYRLKP